MCYVYKLHTCYTGHPPVSPPQERVTCPCGATGCTWSDACSLAVWTIWAWGWPQTALLLLVETVPTQLLEDASSCGCWQGGEVRWEAPADSSRQGRSRAGESAGVWNISFHQQLEPDVVLSQHGVQTGLPWCLQPGVPAAGALPQGTRSSLPPAWFHLAILKQGLHTPNNTVQRNNYSPNSVLTRAPHTQVMHTLCCQGPSATHALHQQKLLLPERERPWCLLIMNTVSGDS